VVIGGVWDLGVKPITKYLISNCKLPITFNYQFTYRLPFTDYFLPIMKDFIIVNTLDELDVESKDLVHKAEEILPYAYAPYSKFRVGAALLLDNGVIVTGTNQENAAYPAGMCAERVALFTMASQYPGVVVKKLAVVAKAENTKDLSPATCCGSCRQVMLEFEQRQNKAFEVIMRNQDHQWVKAPSAESLLPFSFTKTSMKQS
jgi:cytidine deaminase